MATTLREYLDKVGVLTLWGQMKALIPSKTSDLSNDSGFITGDNVAFIGDDDGTGGSASGGQVNVIETVKVNGTALVPDANKAVAIQLKTINSQSIVGTGDITIQGGGSGAGEANIIETVKVNGSALTPDASKAVDIPVPIALADLSTDSAHQVVTNSEKTKWNAATEGLEEVYLAEIDDATSPGIYEVVDPTAFGVPYLLIVNTRLVYNPGGPMQSYVDQISVTKDAVSKRNKAPDGDWSEWTDIYSSKYTKPSGGIPKTDLASEVQTSLGKADTALQTLPTNVSAFTNDAGYLTDADTVTIYSGSSAPSSSLGSNGDIYIQTS